MGCLLQALTRSKMMGLCSLAIVLTVAAVLKPILWDDEVYFQFAQHIAHHPLDPYGAQISIDGSQYNGFLVLAPPFILYWWGGAIAFFGNTISLTAIALFPFALAYTVSFYMLAGRGAPELASVLTVMATLSAWPLVTISYMQDFPVVALDLAALALFIEGSERRSRCCIVAAGVLAGLALETKYSAAAGVCVIVLWGLIARRFIDGLLAAAIALLLFCAVEAAIAAKYGHSHFLFHLFAGLPGSSGLRAEIIRLRTITYGFVQNSSSVSIGALLLLPVALGFRRKWIIVNTAFVILAFVLSALGLDRIFGNVLPGATPQDMPMVLTTSGLLGLAVLIYGVVLLVSHAQRQLLFGDQWAFFLAAWILIEVLIYFVTAPFPAARRMGEIAVPMLLLVGRLVKLRRSGATQPQFSDHGRFVNFSLVVTAFCGLTMLAISLVDGWNVVTTARVASSFMQADGRDVHRWQIASLALAHYLDADGVARIDRSSTTLQPGDLLAIDEIDPNFTATLQAEGLQAVAAVRGGINLGVSVSTAFYRAANPWVAGRDTRPEIIIFRADKAARIPADFER